MSSAAEKRTSYLELFFDLVFVFAITQLASMLHDDHRPAGWVQAALMVWLIWWAWSQFTWAGNAIDLERRPMRLAILGVSGLVLLAAIALPDAYTDAGLWFALPYVAVRLSGLGLYWVGLADQPEHRAALRTYLPVASISPLLVLLGGFVGSSARPWVWAGAVAVDLASVAAAGRGEFRVSPTHFAERHALIVIIALGESVIAVGATASSREATAALGATAVAGFVIVATLWWTYFDWVHEASEQRLANELDHRRRAHLARDLFTLAHFPIVAGTVVFAVGVEEAVLHPTEPLDSFGRVAIAGGITLFMTGFLAGNARATHRLFVERLVAAVAVVGWIALAGPHLSALAVLSGLAVVLIATTAVENVRHTDQTLAA